MVPDQILARHTEVHGVPVVELILQRGELFLSDTYALLGIVGLVEEDEVEGLDGQGVSGDARWAKLTTFKDTALEEMGNGVVGHVDGRVGQRLNDELLIPRDAGSETSSPGAAPLFEPFEDELELFLGLRVVSLEAIRLDVLFDLVLPGLLTVAEEPLVTKGNDAAFASTRGNGLLRLVVRHCKAFIDHLLANDGLGLLTAHASAVSNLHDTLIEGGLVALVFGLINLESILVRRDLHLLDYSLGAKVAKAIDIDDWHGFKALNPLDLDAHALTVTDFGLQVAEHGEISRRVPGNGGDDSCSLDHADRGEGQDVDVLVSRHRGLDLHSDEVSTFDSGESGVLELNLGHLLMSKVPSSALCNDEQIVVLHLVDAIVASGKDEAVGLAVHSLGAERACHKEDIALSELLELGGEVEQTDLDASVLLGSNTLASGAIVISAGLVLRLGVDRVAFAELDLVVVLEMVELPADEPVVVGVLRGSDEVSPPISVEAHFEQVLLAKGREEIEPVVGVGELRDRFLADTKLHEDLVLGERREFRVLGCCLFLGRSGLVAARHISSNLALEADSRRRDRHASAVEGKGEEGAFANLSLETSHELGLRHGVGVT